MKKVHRTVLPALEDALDKVKAQRLTIHGGLAGAELTEVPEIDNPHEVSHTHPFTTERDEEKP